MRIVAQGHYNTSPIPTDDPTSTYVQSIGGTRYVEVIKHNKLETYEDIKTIIKEVLTHGGITLYRIAGKDVVAVNNSRLGWLLLNMT